MIDRFDIVEGHYWFYCDWHGGQGTKEYKRLCKLTTYFKPGILQHHVSTEESLQVYITLMKKYGYDKKQPRLLKQVIREAKSHGIVWMDE